MPNIFRDRIAINLFISHLVVQIENIRIEKKQNI